MMNPARDFEENIPTVEYPKSFDLSYAVPHPRAHARLVARKPYRVQRENQIATAILVSIILVIAAVTIAICWTETLAHADTVSAAAGSGSGSAIAAPAGSAAAPASTSLTNPTSDPLAYLTELQTLWHQSWSSALMFAIWGLLEITTLASSKESWLAFLNAGRWKVAIAGGISVTAAALNAALAGGAWVAMLTAAASALLLAITSAKSSTPA